MEVKIKKLHPDAVIPYKNYPSDFCYDVVAVSEEEVAPNVWKYGLGIALQIMRDTEIIENPIADVDRYGNCYGTIGGKGIDLHNSNIKLSIDIRPRSSIYKTGMVLSNSEGTVDENYNGEIFLVFYHVLPNMPRYKVGNAIAQMKIGTTFPINFVEVKELSKTDRNDGGFGHTGI